MNVPSVLIPLTEKSLVLGHLKYGYESGNLKKPHELISMDASPISGDAARHFPRLLAFF